MAGYVSSNSERLYVVKEAAYGQVRAGVSRDRIPVVRFTARQQFERGVRRDKTGTRTYVGHPANGRRTTEFSINTYLTSWSDQNMGPSYGPLFEASLGGSVRLSSGLVTAPGTTASVLSFEDPHGLVVGQGVSFGGELRFVAALPDLRTVVLNQAFSSLPFAGSSLANTASYSLATDLPSVSVFDYWTPATALQRVVVGGGVDQMRIQVNGDFHEFAFRGIAADLMDSSSFQAGSAGLTEFPAEPPLADFNYSVVPGHLGQAWIGAIPNQMYTLTEAQVTLENSLSARDREFGIAAKSCLVPGERRIQVSMALYEKDDAATMALYQAARQRSPISVMFQLGQQQGQLFALWIGNLIPEVPEFDDRETRLVWRFGEAQASGGADDELFVAFA